MDSSEVKPRPRPGPSRSPPRRPPALTRSASLNEVGQSKRSSSLSVPRPRPPAPPPGKRSLSPPPTTKRGSVSVPRPIPPSVPAPSSVSASVPEEDEEGKTSGGAGDGGSVSTSKASEEVNELSRAANHRLIRAMSSNDVGGGRQTPASFLGAPTPGMSSSSSSLSSPSGVSGATVVEENINVGVRCRPMASHELKAAACKAVSIDRAHGRISISEDTFSSSNNSGGGDGGGLASDEASDEYKFNFAYPSSVETFEIYEEMVHPIIRNLFNGFNGTVLCYGQTGSGKTYTVSGTAADPGIVPIAVNELFYFCRERAGLDSFQVTLGYLEIYNERIFDLCSFQGNVSQELPLYEDPALGTRVRGLSESLVTTPETVLHTLALAQSSRKMASTAMNLNSSRSHTITRLVVESTSLSDGVKKQSMLSLVDLAGSERASKTMAKGDTLREGAFINKSLLTLSSVIAELCKDKPGHVPFRDSKLTRLLQSSLGGNSKTALVCNISPADNQLAETKSTLQFGKRAASVVNKTTMNSSVDTASALAAYQAEIARLKQAQAQLVSLVKLVADEPATVTTTHEVQEEEEEEEAAVVDGDNAAAASDSTSAVTPLPPREAVLPGLGWMSLAEAEHEQTVSERASDTAQAPHKPMSESVALKVLRSLHAAAKGQHHLHLAWLSNQAAVRPHDKRPPPGAATAGTVAAAAAAAAAAVASASAVAASAAPSNSSPLSPLTSDGREKGQTSSGGGKGGKGGKGRGKGGGGVGRGGLGVKGRQRKARPAVRGSVSLGGGRSGTRSKAMKVKEGVYMRQVSGDDCWAPAEKINKAAGGGGLVSSGGSDGSDKEDEDDGSEDDDLDDEEEGGEYEFDMDDEDEDYEEAVLSGGGNETEAEAAMRALLEQDTPKQFVKGFSRLRMASSVTKEVKLFTESTQREANETEIDDDDESGGSAVKGVTLDMDDGDGGDDAGKDGKDGKGDAATHRSTVALLKHAILKLEECGQLFTGGDATSSSSHTPKAELVAGSTTAAAGAAAMLRVGECLALVKEAVLELTAGQRGAQNDDLDLDVGVGDVGQKHQVCGPLAVHPVLAKEEVVASGALALAALKREKEEEEEEEERVAAARELASARSLLEAVTQQHGEEQARCCLKLAAAEGVLNEVLSGEAGEAAAAGAAGAGWAAATAAASEAEAAAVATPSDTPTSPFLAGLTRLEERLRRYKKDQEDERRRRRHEQEMEEREQEEEAAAEEEKDNNLKDDSSSSSDDDGRDSHDEDETYVKGGDGDDGGSDDDDSFVLRLACSAEGLLAVDEAGVALRARGEFERLWAAAEKKACLSARKEEQAKAALRQVMLIAVGTEGRRGGGEPSGDGTKREKNKRETRLSLKRLQFARLKESAQVSAAAAAEALQVAAEADEMIGKRVAAIEEAEEAAGVQKDEGGDGGGPSPPSSPSSPSLFAAAAARHFERKANLLQGLLSDATQGQRLAEGQLRALQDLAEAAHLSALAIDAPPDLVVACGELSGKLASTKVELSAKEAQLGQANTSLMDSSRLKGAWEVERSGLEFVSQELRRSKHALGRQVRLLEGKVKASNAGKAASTALAAKALALALAAAATTGAGAGAGSQKRAVVRNDDGGDGGVGQSEVGAQTEATAHDDGRVETTATTTTGGGGGNALLLLELAALARQVTSGTDEAALALVRVKEAETEERVAQLAAVHFAAMSLARREHNQALRACKARLEAALLVGGGGAEGTKQKSAYTNGKLHGVKQRNN